jgi:two-component system sensor histidine kinase SenX3
MQQGSAGETLELFRPPRRTLVIRASVLEPQGVLAVVEDVTEHQRLEAARRDFVSNISHELKTPVGAVALLAETILDEDDAEVGLRLTKRMLAEAHRVGHTIDDLLTLSQIEAEETPPRESVGVGVLVSEVTARVRPAAEQRGVEVIINEPSPRLTVLGDRRQLASALYNLVDNAVKYSGSEDSVTIETSTDGVTVDVVINDQGIGIPKRDIDRIFERFYRVDQARSRQTGGTGLGLAIVRHIADNHGGEVLVESRIGEGSTFTLRLPVGSLPVPVEAKVG